MFVCKIRGKYRNKCLDWEGDDREILAHVNS